MSIQHPWPAKENVAAVLAVAGIEGPQILYVDNSQGARTNVVFLTLDDPDGATTTMPTPSSGSAFTSRERALIRALLYLAQERLDHINPHD